MNARKARIEAKTGLSLIELPKNAKHEVGKTYYSGYWGITYKVLSYEEKPESWMRYIVTCQWEDGRITKHCTDLNYKEDFMVA
jgi:hypothetical protein